MPFSHFHSTSPSFSVSGRNNANHSLPVFNFPYHHALLFSPPSTWRYCPSFSPIPIFPLRILNLPHPRLFFPSYFTFSPSLTFPFFIFSNVGVCVCGQLRGGGSGSGSSAPPGVSWLRAPISCRTNSFPQHAPLAVPRTRQGLASQGGRHHLLLPFSSSSYPFVLLLACTYFFPFNSCSTFCTISTFYYLFSPYLMFFHLLLVFLILLLLIFPLVSPTLELVTLALKCLDRDRVSSSLTSCQILLSSRPLVRLTRGGMNLFCLMYFLGALGSIMMV